MDILLMQRIISNVNNEGFLILNKNYLKAVS